MGHGGRGNSAGASKTKRMHHQSDRKSDILESGLHDWHPAALVPLQVHARAQCMIRRLNTRWNTRNSIKQVGLDSFVSGASPGKSTRL